MIDLQQTPAATAALIRRKIADMKRIGYALASEPIKVFRSIQQPTRDEIASSIRRKRKGGSLLAIAADAVFLHDLDVGKFWKVDWKATVAILAELEK